MGFEINVNGKSVYAERGETVLDVLRRNGIDIPTLCHVKGLSPTGACRLCVVELEDDEQLRPSCSLPAAEGMKINTHSSVVLNARRQTVELLLASHPQDCLYCIRNGECQLQDLSAQFHIQERRLPQSFLNSKADNSTESIVIEPSKCILCERCIRFCNEVMKTNAIELFGKGTRTMVRAASLHGLQSSPCISCGQCTLVCPTAAIHEKDATEVVRNALYRNDISTTAVFAPECGVSLGELLGIRPGKDITALMPALLRRMGFDRVMNSGLGNDLASSISAMILERRLKSETSGPLISSSCPSSYIYLEKHHPELLASVISTPSPAEIMAELTSCMDDQQPDKSKDFHIAIVPCTSLKQEIHRKRESRNAGQIKAVITTRELAKLVHILGIDINAIEEELPDDPFDYHNYSTYVNGISGGTTESIARELFLRVNGKELLNARISKIRSNRDIKEIKIRLGKTEYSMMAVNGIANLKQAIPRIRGRKDLIFVELMACPGGCINGGGQPIHPDENKLKARNKALVDHDVANNLKAAQRCSLLEKLMKNETTIDTSTFTSMLFRKEGKD